MTRCNQNHIGGPGIRLGRRCVHLGPLGLALALAVITEAAALSNPHTSLAVDIVAGLFWPVFSLIGQLVT